MFDLSFQPQNETERNLWGELQYYQQLFSTCYMALQRISAEGNALDNIRKDAQRTLEEVSKLGQAHGAPKDAFSRT